MTRSEALARWRRQRDRPREQTTFDDSGKTHETGGEALYASSKGRRMHMDISKLRVGDKGADISGAIVFVGDLVDGGKAKGGNRRRIGVKDETATVFFTLFGDNAELEGLKIGAKATITNGYVTEYAGKPQFNVGRYGSIQVE